MEKIIDISIIIVNYKTDELTLHCVSSILDNHSDISIEFIVVGNSFSNSLKHCLEKLSINTTYIQVDYNSGFGRANNKGLKMAKGKYFLLLNSDIAITNKDILNDCISKINQLPAKTILSCKLVNSNLSYQISTRFEYPSIKHSLRANPLCIKFNLGKTAQEIKEKTYLLHTKNGFNLWNNGAFLLFKNTLIKTDKLFFDEDFFLYGEDVEWAFRCNKKGYRFYFYQDKSVIHLGSASSNHNSVKQMQITISDYLFSIKSYGRLYLILWIFIDLLNILFDKLLNMKNKKSKHIKDQLYLNRLKLYAIKKYSKILIFSNSFSSEKTFKLNCYEDTFIQTKAKEII